MLPGPFDGEDLGPELFARKYMGAGRSQWRPGLRGGCCPAGDFKGPAALS